MVELSPYIEIYQPVPGRYVAYDYLSRQAFPVNTPNRSKIAEAMSKSDLAEQLRERCILVDDRIGALDDYVKRFEYKNTQQLLVDGIIHLNYDCNLRCPYCYQSQIRNNTRLSDVGLRRILSFLEERCGLDNTGSLQKQLSLTLIGGEPTLHPELISTLREHVEKNKWSLYESQIVSNGVDITRRTVEDLADAGIHKWNITVDGVGETNDRLRFGGENVSSFTSIGKSIQLIQETSESAQVHINMNLCRENANQVLELCEWLTTLEHRGTLGFSWVFQPTRDTNIDILHKKDTTWAEAISIAEEYGYSTNAFNRTSHLGCSMFGHNTFIIGADEMLYSCINGVGQERYRIGRISNWADRDFQARRRAWLDFANRKSCCSSCRFLPVCNGGCEYLNNLHGFDCPKKSFEANEEAVLITHLGMPTVPN